ncbi:MAG: HDIG domain-containing metalloprotein [Verrucomicrobiota bacterium]
MLDFFQRQRLVKKGLASPKTRRRRSSSEISQALESGTWVKALIVLAFVAGLAGLITGGHQPQPTQNFVIGLLIFLTALGQLWINHPQTFAKNSHLFLVLAVCFAHLAIIRGILALSLSGTVDREFGPLLIPYAFAPLVLSVLLDKNHGIFAAIFVSLWGGVIAVRQIDPSVFIVISLISGFIAVFVTLQVRQRSRLIRAGLFVGLATWLMAIMFGLIGPIVWEIFGGIDWKTIALESVAVVGTSVVTAILVGGALPILESLFQITTDISWLEAADLNHPLLKRMTIEAPGTYHHSLVVANLAEAAAESIGANPTMARVCAYFHDIGKLVKPDYFTENINPERDPHSDLAPTMSALIIIAHVKEGVDLALKHNLKKSIMDVIQQHHGTSLVWFFYKRALQQQEDARQGGKIMNIREEDIPEVREESFRYSGPLPQTKECAIISLADCVESASRSLEKVTPQRVDQMIHDIVQKRILDGQLDECDLSLHEIKTISASFKSTLLSMLHSRVAYPKQGQSPEGRGNDARAEDRRAEGAPARPVSAA